MQIFYANFLCKFFMQIFLQIFYANFMQIFYANSVCKFIMQIFSCKFLYANFLAEIISVLGGGGDNNRTQDRCDVN